MQFLLMKIFYFIGTELHLELIVLSCEFLIITKYFYLRVLTFDVLYLILKLLK